MAIIHTYTNGDRTITFVGDENGIETVHMTVRGHTRVSKALPTETWDKTAKIAEYCFRNTEAI